MITPLVVPSAWVTVPAAFRMRSCIGTTGGPPGNAYPGHNVHTLPGTVKKEDLLTVAMESTVGLDDGSWRPLGTRMSRSTGPVTRDWSASEILASIENVFVPIVTTGSTRHHTSDQAVHLKLDELIRTVQNARSELIAVEHEDDATLAKLEKEFEVERKLLVR